MWTILISAIALLLVMEGILPFLSPALWKRSMLQLAGQSNRALRIMGLVSMLLGVIILIIVHHS